MKLELVQYAELNSRQKENYNFQKLSAVLADYGYVTMRLPHDRNCVFEPGYGPITILVE